MEENKFKINFSGPLVKDLKSLSDKDKELFIGCGLITCRLLYGLFLGLPEAKLTTLSFEEEGKHNAVLKELEEVLGEKEVLEMKESASRLSEYSFGHLVDEESK